MQCTSALLCLNDCGKSHMFIDSFVHHHFRDSFFLYSLPASCTWTFRGSLGLSDLPSIDVQHLVCGSLFWRYWHIPKLWKIGKSIRPANTTQYGKTEFLASQNSARIPNEPVEMQSQEPKGPKKLQNFAEMAKLVYHQNELAHLAAPNGHKLSQLMQF